MSDGYQVDPQALSETAKGINSAIAELKKLGFDETAYIGQGFEFIVLTGEQLGNQDLFHQFGQFCSRWNWGVRTLIQDGNQIAKDLDLTAGEYYDAEQYASGTFKDLVNDTAGNPHASDQQVEKESWNQVLSQPYNDITHPDYSAKSWEKTAEDASKTWRTEGRDVTEGPLGVGKYAADAVGMGDDYQRGGDMLWGKDSRPENNGGEG